MKNKLNILLGSALLLASAGASWAGPSPDLMNSALSARFQAAKNSSGASVSNTKHECARGSVWSHTRTITAGQSTIAIPDLAYHCDK
jgi:hypothetical protein